MPSKPTSPGSPSLSEVGLLRLALQLGAAEMGGALSQAEARAVATALDHPPIADEVVAATRAQIASGEDPLGDMLSQLRTPARRRLLGAFYTPSSIVTPMVAWALAHDPVRVVDPGCGSGRFAAAALRQRPNVDVVAIDLDPVATLLTRGALAVLHPAKATVLQRDFTRVRLPWAGGRTAWVGNPPYVRHHTLTQSSKAWAAKTAERLGHHISGLAGLHAHFFLGTAAQARAADVLCFITSAEWLDVGYGQIVRDLCLNGIGMRALHLLDPKLAAFDDAMTTAVITCGEVGKEPETIRARQVTAVADLASLELGDEVPRERLAATRRWSPVVRRSPAQPRLQDQISVGSLFRVHRGVATGSNSYFVLNRSKAEELGITEWCCSAITEAREILESGGVVRDSPARRLLLNIPAETDRRLHPALDSYLRRGERPLMGANPVAEGYLASHRKPWWCVGRVGRPPIVVSYMARQPPVFALNPHQLALINVAHGLYPVEPMGDEELATIVRRLNASRAAFSGHGRTYQGGLEKFEPKELEALQISIDEWA